MSKRILTFDFLRGFSIICIVAFHLLLLTCEIATQAEIDPFSLHPVYLAIALFTVVFAHWRGLFLIISSVVHIFVMTNAIRNGADRKKLWISQIKFGLMLWIFGMIREVFLNEWSMPYSIAEGMSFFEALQSWWTWIYLMEAIEDIAWSVMITATIFYILTKNNGIDKINRNISVFLVLTIVVIFVSPYVRQLSNIIFGQDIPLTSPNYLIFLGWWDYLLRIFIYPFIHYNSPLFPMLAYTFAGVVFGLLLTRPVIPKNFTRNVYLFCLGLVVLGVVWLIFVDKIPSNISEIITFQFHPTWYLFLAIGLQLIFITFIMRKIEFNPKIKLDKILRKTYIGRRWGVTALTVYSFLSFEYVVRAIMNFIVPSYNWLQFRTLPFGWSVGLIAITIMAWMVILWAWEKGKFKYSLEWFFTKIAKKNKPGKTLRTEDLLDVEGVLQKPEVILFVQPINEQKEKYLVLGNKS